MIRVRDVEALENFILKLQFTNGEIKFFDVKPYLNKGIFNELRDINLFKTVHTAFDTVEWNNGADICPDELYECSYKE